MCPAEAQGSCRKEGKQVVISLHRRSSSFSPSKRLPRRFSLALPNLPTTQRGQLGGLWAPGLCAEEERVTGENSLIQTGPIKHPLWLREWTYQGP